MQGLQRFFEFETVKLPGIQKLTGALNENELKDMTNRLEAIVQASKRSNMIGGMADNMTGESRMIFKTMEIKK